MARTGSFSGGTQDYGSPLSVTKPADNKPASPYDEALLDPALKLTDAQKRELQERIEELYAVMRGEREYFS